MRIYYALLGLAFLNGYSQTVSVTDAKNLTDCININHHIETVRETTLMWVSPSKECDYLLYFDDSIEDFKKSVLNYYIRK